MDRDMKKYDYIVVGTGLAGSTFANLAAKDGKQVLMLERKNHIAGNIHTPKEDEIFIHQYGAHIFHTNDYKVWRYLNVFTRFSDYKHEVVARHEDSIYQLPFNMMTFQQVFGKFLTISEAKRLINEEIKAVGITEPKNLEEKAISMVGTTVYEKLIKNYTEKQWGCKCSELPESIISRLPLRFNYDNTYFNNAEFQGIPVNGYTEMISNMISDNQNIEIRMNCDFLENVKEIESMLKPEGQIIYTGAIDELFKYELGILEYRSVRWVTEKAETDSVFGTSVINFTDETDATRAIEHKHFDVNCKNSTSSFVSYEFSEKFVPLLNEPFYPIGKEKNQKLYKEYVELQEKEKPNYIMLGRLATYQYLDMDKVVRQVMEKYEEITKK